MSDRLIEIIFQQTKILFENVQETFNSIPDAEFDKVIIRAPHWQQFYHMLHSLDQWFINPNDYIEPDFHEPGMNYFDKKPQKSLSKSELVNYFNTIKEKTVKYLEGLDTASLKECPVNCKFTRLDLILSQFRHLMYHIGFLHSCILYDTNKMPEFIGISPPIIK